MKVRLCSARTKEIERTTSQCFQRRWAARPAADAHRFPQSVQLWPRSRAASGFFRRILFSVISSERSFSAIWEPWCSKGLHLDLSPASLKSGRRNFERDTRTSFLVRHPGNVTTPSQLTMADVGFNRDSFASLKYFKIWDQVLPFDATYGTQVEGLELLDVRW